MLSVKKRNTTVITSICFLPLLSDLEMEWLLFHLLFENEVLKTKHYNKYAFCDCKIGFTERKNTYDEFCLIFIEGLLINQVNIWWHSDSLIIATKVLTCPASLHP